MTKKTQEVITLTFGDMAENHVGMEQIGSMVNEGEGFNLKDINHIKTTMENLGSTTELIKLSDDKKPDAYILIIKDGVNKILQNCSNFDKDQLFKEQKDLNYDKKAFMYGRVVNKHARWNLCYDESSRDPNYEEGKGRIIGYDKIPITRVLKENFETLFGSKATNLKIESNYYYDVNKCGIGFHGDSERRKVIGVRLGNISLPLPIHYQWYYKGNPEGERIILPLNNGDIYIMSEKAVGTDWKKKNIYTLRHGTGCEKYTKL
jgi:hypothetical protein